MSFTAEGLKNGTAYTFTVQTLDKALNESTGTKTLTAVKPIDTSDKTAPAEVTELKAEALAGAVLLTWKDPENTDLWGIEITSLEQIIAVRGVMHTEPLQPNTILAAKGQQSIRISNLTVGKPYTFTVKTIDLSGNKSAGTSTTESVTPIAGEPMKLKLSQTPQASDWTNGSVTISFTSNTSVKTAKWIKGVKTLKEIFASGTEISGTSFEVTENGTYSVAVQDDDGRREVETIEITNIDKKPPFAPSHLIAVYKPSEKKIVLNWTDPADKESGVKELKLTYTVNGGSSTDATITKGTQTFEITDVEPQSPPVPYAFSLKAVDNAGNEGTAAAATVKPSEQAEITGIEVSPKKIEKNDPNKKVTVTLHGFNLAKAAEIKIKGPGVTPVTLSNVTGSSASAEFTLPNTVKDTVFTVEIKQTAADAFTLVDGVRVKAQVCEPAKVTRMEVTKQDGSNFKTDNYGALKVEAGTGGSMKIVLTGTNLDTDGLKAGVRFNGQDYEGTANGDGTQLTIENIAIPSTSGVYPIKAQLKPRYKTEYTILPDETGWNAQYQSKLLRVLGSVVLKELQLSGYDKTLEGSEGWLVIKGENLDNLTADDLSNITSSLGGGVTHAKIIDSTTLKAQYTIPDLNDDSVIDKTETLTIAGKTVSSPLHTLKIEKNFDKYTVTGYYSIPSDGKVRIPEYITAIGGRAFQGCAGLTEVTLPASLTSIGQEAFNGCKELTSVTFPASLTEINGSAFSACVKLVSIDLSGTKLTKINSSAFKDCAGLTEVTLPASLTSIGNYAFNGCAGLTEVTLPASLTGIDDYAFSACVKLASVDLSATKLTQISSSAFSGCTGLTEVTLPASLTSIDYRAFDGCAGLTSIDLSGTKLTDIQGKAFSNCADLTEVTLPASLTSIGEQAFKGCAKLERADLSATKLTKINQLAFYGCAGLTEVTLPASLTSIGQEAFKGCAGLTEVTLPASLTKIGRAAFNDCAKLERAVFADTAGWAVYEMFSDEKYADIQATDLQNPATAAEYVRSKYSWKYWKKN